MKKGFTLVELAIVLVIVGILVGMAIKGKSLIDVAKVMAQVAKIQKVNVAIVTFIGEGRTFPNVGNNFVDTAPLLVSGIISQKDLYLEDSDSSGSDGGVVSGGNISLLHSFRDNIPDIGTFQNNPTQRIYYIRFISPSIRLSCGVERVLDDENFSTGPAVLFRGPSLPAYTTACDDGGSSKKFDISTAYSIEVSI